MKNLKVSMPSRAYIFTLIGGLIIGCIGMNMFDAFVSSHTFSYQSPILVQAPIIIKNKDLAGSVIIKTVEATGAATEATTAAIISEPIKK